tara:strand:- start:956 stop:2044 length:1089 start_codon:yes stop_codon:yes gene_type:complete
MKIKLKNTPEQVELIKAMGSKSPEISRPATEAFAAFIGPVVQQVLNQANTASYIYTDVEYDEDDNPSYPLDLFYDQNGKDPYVTIWSQQMAGGLPSSQIAGNAELKIATYKLDSAVSFLKKYARKSRLDVVSKGIERMANEILVKQDRNAWAVVLKGLAEAKGKWGTGAAGSNVVNQGTRGAFSLADLNALMTKMKRLNASYANGTPAAAYSKGITDLFVSAEVVEDIRAISYNPYDTTSDQVGDGVKDEMYRSAGFGNLFGVNIVDLYELGSGQKYNTLYTAAGIGGTLAAGQQIMVGVDRSVEAFVRPVARNSDTGGTFTALPDDQYAQRQDKVGFYGGLEEGRVLLDARAVVGLRKDIA